jgi:hypothetical protein
MGMNDVRRIRAGREIEGIFPEPLDSDMINLLQADARHRAMSRGSSPESSHPNERSIRGDSQAGGIDVSPALSPAEIIPDARP